MFCTCVIVISFDWKSCQSTDWRKLSNPKVWVDAAEQVFSPLTFKRQLPTKNKKWKTKTWYTIHTYSEHVSKSSIKGHIKVLEQNNKNCESYVLRPKVIFSLGPACGCVITLSSYNRSQIFASFSLGNVGNGKTGKSPWCLNPNTCEFNIFLSLVSVSPFQVWAKLPQGRGAHRSF